MVKKYINRILLYEMNSVGCNEGFFQFKIGLLYWVFFVMNMQLMKVFCEEYVCVVCICCFFVDNVLYNE